MKNFLTKIGKWLEDDQLSDGQAFSRVAWIVIFALLIIAVIANIVVALYVASPLLVGVALITGTIYFATRWTYAVFHYTKADDE